jgi:hypothetical protein
VVVQRDDKLPVVAASLREFIALDPAKAPLVLVGCKDAALVARLLGSGVVRSAGFVPANALFEGGSDFVQPTGYGEGLPHTLADAVVSGMTVIAPLCEVRRYGLQRLGGVATPFAGQWVSINPNPQMQTALSLPVITAAYVTAFNQI